MRPTYSQSENRLIYVVAGAISLMLSAWIALHENVINTDGICYVLSASEVGHGGLHSAMQICSQARWPLYSTLLFAISKVTFLSPITSAFLIDSLFTLITVLSFISIVRILGGTRRVLWLAAFVILSAHQFNNVRQYIIRDHGFWAFYLLSLFFMLRFMHERNRWYAVAFGASLIAATLFRIEGGVFLVLLPFLAFFDKDTTRRRVRAFFQLNSMTLLSVGVLLTWLLMNPGESINKLGRLPELINQMTGVAFVITQKFTHSTTMLVKHVLPFEAARDANMLWFAALVGSYFLNLINNISWIAVGLVIYAWVSGVTQTFSRVARTVLFGYVGVNLLVTAAFFAHRIFLSKRYIIALTLVLLLWVPFALDKLLREGSSARQRITGYALMLMLAVSTMGVIVGSGYSKNYIREAGDWLSVNVPQGSKLYSNDQQVAFYSQQFGRELFKTMREYRDIPAMVQGKLQHYQYAALRSGREQDDRLAVVLHGMNAKVEKQFKNRRGDNVTIYKIPR